MPTDDVSLAAVPSVALAFMKAHRIPTDSVRADGRLTLTIDQRYRVHVQPAPHNQVVLQSELLALPEQNDSLKDDVLLRLAKTGAGMLQQHASTLCIDQKRQALVLQQTLQAAADVQALQDALANFTSALALWTRLCRAESAVLKGESR